MKNKRLLSMFLLFSLFLPSINHADEAKIRDWTQEVLLSTLSINYTQTVKDFAIVRQNYLPRAWASFTNFFSSELGLIRQRRLSLHPIALEPPTIATSGIFSGIHY